MRIRSLWTVIVREFLMFLMSDALTITTGVVMGLIAETIFRAIGLFFTWWSDYITIGAALAISSIVIWAIMEIQAKVRSKKGRSSTNWL